MATCERFGSSTHRRGGCSASGKLGRGLPRENGFHRINGTLNQFRSLFCKVLDHRLAVLSGWCASGRLANLRIHLLDNGSGAEQVAALAEADRPRYLAILVTPGSEAAAGWRERYSATLTQWGYNSRVETKFGGIYERIFR